MEKRKMPPLRVREETHRQLKLIAALTGESMIGVVARIVKAELASVQKRVQAVEKERS